MIKYLDVKHPIGDDPLVESAIPVLNDYLNTFHELQKIVHIDSAAIGRYVHSKEEITTNFLSKRYKNKNI